MEKEIARIKMLEILKGYQYMIEKYYADININQSIELKIISRDNLKYNIKKMHDCFVQNFSFEEEYLNDFIEELEELYINTLESFQDILYKYDEYYFTEQNRIENTNIFLNDTFKTRKDV